MRLIDADKLLETIAKNVCGDCDSHLGVVCASCKMDDAVSIIDQADTVDAVPVVRCKDCEHSTKPKSPCKEGVMKCGKPGGIAWNRLVYSDDFCAYGERKEEKDV